MIIYADGVVRNAAPGVWSLVFEDYITLPPSPHQRARPVMPFIMGRGEAYPMLTHRYMRWHEGTEVRVSYMNNLCTDGCTYWAPAACQYLDELRLQMGLGPSPHQPYRIIFARSPHVDHAPFAQPLCQEPMQTPPHDPHQTIHPSCGTRSPSPQASHSTGQGHTESSGHTASDTPCLGAATSEGR